MSCLFISLGRLVGHDPTALREMICEFMQQNPSILAGETVETVVGWTYGVPVNEYIREMRSTSTWGSALEIKSFCEIFGARVIVHNIADNNKIIEFLPTTWRGATMYISWNGTHYEPIRLEN